MEQKQNGRTRIIKRYALFCLALVILVALLVYRYGGTPGRDKWIVHDPADPILRVHVLAHDDSPAEQKLKNEVRDELLAFVDRYRHIPSYGELIENIEKELVPLENHLRGRLKETDGEPDHRLKVELKEEYFPLRHYGEDIYPPGKYMALVVSIGDGKGQNWWCLLYPPLCFPLAELTDEVEEREEDGQVAIETIATGEGGSEVGEVLAERWWNGWGRYLPEIEIKGRWKIKIWEWIKNCIEKE